MKRLTVSIIALLLGLGALLPSAWAAVGRDQAAALAQKKTPGRVLKVEQGLYMDNSVVWRIHVLTAAGEVSLVVIDAETGRLR
ncbi:PepSY domain-containing protein [Ramlibacter sp. XY19]|uniref:PepSY domain-containing protein n=1 Tax=Ramlibacter paludis TaxID=2908000 RepID=UPI0023DA165A|nr:PepSY domain-containing protein [Ramlibacter paludis]MCG2591448.1 PepSY domain-containing protein [Ramlibacter paludis]